MAAQQSSFGSPEHINAAECITHLADGIWVRQIINAIPDWQENQQGERTSWAISSSCVKFPSLKEDRTSITRIHDDAAPRCIRGVLSAGADPAGMVLPGRHDLLKTPTLGRLGVSQRRYRKFLRPRSASSGELKIGYSPTSSLAASVPISAAVISTSTFVANAKSERGSTSPFRSSTTSIFQ